MSESPREKLDRLKWMADPDEGSAWDLSPNDRHAIASMLSMNARLTESLRAIWQLIENGQLVRDISRDHEPDWAMKALTLTRTLQEADATLKAAPLGEEEYPHASDCAVWVHENCNCTIGKAAK